MASIQHIKDDKYRVFFCVDRKRKTLVIHAKSGKDAEKQAIILENKIKETGTLSGRTEAEFKGVYFPDLADKYLDYLVTRERAVKKKTVQHYIDILKYQLSPYFKAYKVSAIKVYEIEQYMKWIKTPEARFNTSSRRPYSQATVHDAFNLLDTMLDKAVDWGMIPTNPCKKVDRPVKPVQTSSFYDVDEVVEMLDLLDTETKHSLDKVEAMRNKGTYAEFTLEKEINLALSHQLMVYLAIMTAARRGEVLGLHREDIDLDKRIIHFHCTLLYTKEAGVYVEDGLKTRDELFTPINDDMVDMIKDYLVELDKLIELSNGQISKDNSLLFMTLKTTDTRSIGSPVMPDPVSAWFKAFIDRHGLKPITFHKLRHSAISYLIHCGVDVLTVSKIAGHSTIQQISQRYGHIYDKDKIQAVGHFEQLSRQNRQRREKVQ